MSAAARGARGGGGGGGRLPSFKGQRDLSLGGSGSGVKSGGATADKKKFVPNLNVQRRKDEIKKEVPDAGAFKPSERGGRGRGGGRGGRSSGGRGGLGGQKAAAGGGGGGRVKTELIQTMGSVFSEGLSAEGGIRRKTAAGYGGARDEADGGLRRPLVSSLREVKVDKEAEEKRLQALLKDDFVSDLSCEGLYVPVQLPMIDTGKAFKNEQEDGDGDEEEAVVSTKKPRANQIVDSDDEDDPKRGGAEVETEKLKRLKEEEKKKSVGGERVELTFPDLVRRQRGDLIFIQLPDHLPGVAEAPQLPIKKEKHGGEEEKDEGEKNCRLSDLNEGYLGKIQVRRSGKTQLKIGCALLDVELGTQVGFLQDLVSIRTSLNPQEVGEMTVMGRVRHRMVVTPDWDYLFKSGAAAADEDQLS